MLARLAAQRKLDVRALARLAGVAESELRSVVDGMMPSPPLLRRLAPALGLHTADLFVMAGTALPDDLAPLDVKARSAVRELVRHAVRLPPEQRRRLRRFAQSMPQQPREQPVPAPRTHEQYPPGYGGMLMRMVMARNLDWLGLAMTFAYLTDGRLYWSAATFGMVGNGRKELTSGLLADFATVLDVSTDDLAALTGKELPDPPLPRNPAAPDIAKLIWDVRRLTAEQVRQVRDQAESMRQQ